MTPPDVVDVTLAIIAFGSGAAATWLGVRHHVLHSLRALREDTRRCAQGDVEQMRIRVDAKIDRLAGYVAKQSSALDQHLQRTHNEQPRFR